MRPVVGLTVSVLFSVSYGVTVVVLFGNERVCWFDCDDHVKGYLTVYKPIPVDRRILHAMINRNQSP